MDSAGVFPSSSPPTGDYIYSSSCGIPVQHNAYAEERDFGLKEGYSSTVMSEPVQTTHPARRNSPGVGYGSAWGRDDDTELVHNNQSQDHMERQGALDKGGGGSYANN